jgi:ribose transport system ATP-binding protein
VIVLYDGTVKRVLTGSEITERALIASALNIAGGEAAKMAASA